MSVSFTLLQGQCLNFSLLALVFTSGVSQDNEPHSSSDLFHILLRSYSLISSFSPLKYAGKLSEISFLGMGVWKKEWLGFH